VLCGVAGIDGSFFNDSFCLGVFLYLTVCSVLDYPDHCFLARIVCDRLHNVSSGFYVNADASFCWPGLFVTTVSIL
jgi:hypothetical protein